MIGTVLELSGVNVFVCAEDGPAMVGDADAVDVLGSMYGLGTRWAAIPVGRLAGDFFQLSTGIAGAMVGKLVGYQVRVAIVGDISSYAAASEPFRDWVRESNRGTDVWFVSDLDELAERLTQNTRARLT
ncbi:DUF4180 domain-containing protein [Fodinicola feengrottensis]|uniref:DUF4180 domain-containing protein n=1 Tax=Fodinicola feengrottensis TaxID=435914 RepID=A0ABN2I0P0_9ACTN|nr:DUF4180 domain-containing protein [Fodinicola feengrottensis]